MAGLLPSFASGSNLLIYIGGRRVAYGTSLQFVDDVTHMPVGGIGAYSHDSLEPTQYIARGSFTLMRYSNLAHSAITGNTGANAGAVPVRSKASSGYDGNTFFHPAHFNPVRLLTGQTFDIVVYERDDAGAPDTTPIFKLDDCRMTGYSLGFTPGSTVAENISFMCLLAHDGVVEAITASTAAIKQILAETPAETEE